MLSPPLVHLQAHQVVVDLAAATLSMLSQRPPAHEVMATAGARNSPCTLCQSLLLGYTHRGYQVPHPYLAQTSSPIPHLGQGTQQLVASLCFPLNNNTDSGNNNPAVLRRRHPSTADAAGPPAVPLCC